MKIKLLLLAALPLLIIQAGCQSTQTGSDPQNPIEGPKSQSLIHGDAGVEMESRNMSGVAPTRPVN